MILSRAQLSFVVRLDYAIPEVDLVFGEPIKSAPVGDDASNSSPSHVTRYKQAFSFDAITDAEF